MTRQPRPPALASKACDQDNLVSRADIQACACSIVKHLSDPTKPGRTVCPSSMLRITTRHLNCCDLTSIGLLTVLDTGATPCAIAGTDFRLWLIFRSGCRMTPSLLDGAKNSDQKRQNKYQDVRSPITAISTTRGRRRYVPKQVFGINAWHVVVCGDQDSHILFEIRNNI